MRTNWRIKEWKGNPPSGLGWKKDDIFKFENNGTFSKLPSDGNTHNWHWIVGSKDSDTPVGISIDGYEFGWETWGSGLWTLYYPRTKPENPSWIINLDGIGNNEEQNDEKPSNTGKYTAVDLGLSVKWATCNVGASKPEEYGDYFAWGETTTKTYYEWSTYKLCESSETSMLKYCTSSNYGKVDNKSTIELADDAAHVNWGGSWRMPTRIEYDELCKKCIWTWTTRGGVMGYEVTSRSNGNSIFLPAAGVFGEELLSYVGSDGYYWTSSLDTGHSFGAYRLDFNSKRGDTDGCERYYGLSVRAVCP